MDLDLVEARWRLGVFPVEGLPEVARGLLTDGHDGVAIQALAELDQPTRTAAASLFEDALDELGREPMPLETAALTAARDIARRVLADDITPREGAHRIAWDVWDRARETERLGVFVTLLEKHETKKEHRDLVEQAIRREAERLLRT